jgi:hypothetical protein
VAAATDAILLDEHLSRSRTTWSRPSPDRGPALVRRHRRHVRVLGAGSRRCRRRPGVRRTEGDVSVASTDDRYADDVHYTKAACSPLPLVTGDDDARYSVLPPDLTPSGRLARCLAGAPEGTSPIEPGSPISAATATGSTA